MENPVGQTFLSDGPSGRQKLKVSLKAHVNKSAVSINPEWFPQRPPPPFSAGRMRETLFIGISLTNSSG
jgi:hypothetical protein